VTLNAMDYRTQNIMSPYSNPFLNDMSKSSGS